MTSIRAAVSEPDGFPPADLEDATVVAAEGQQIARDGVRYFIEGIVPAYGTVGVLITYAKVGKTTFGQALAKAVAKGEPFLDRPTIQGRVLVLAAEDPPGIHGLARPSLGRRTGADDLQAQAADSR